MDTRIDAIIVSAPPSSNRLNPPYDNPELWNEALQNTRRRSVMHAEQYENDLDLHLPPDGGFHAWLQVAVGHIVVFNTWGYINSFGVFQSYYMEALGHPPSDISLVGSLQIFLLFFIGTFSGRAMDAGYFKHTLALGAFVEAFSIFMTSLCTEYWQLLLAQGFGQGIGCGLMFCPTLALIPTYFAKRRAIAIGIVVTGSATGGLVFPAVIVQLMPQLGFGWTMRVLGFITLMTLTPCIFLLRQGRAIRSEGPLIEWAAFCDPTYSLFAAGMFMNFLGLFVAFFFLSSFSRDIIGAGETVSINLVMVLNGVSIVGRLVPTVLADRLTGPLNILLPFSLATAIVSYCWARVDSMLDLWVFAVFYGLFASGVQSLFPATLSTLTTDISKIGLRMGMILSVVAVATLIGSPIAGSLIQLDGGRYLLAQMFMGSSILLGCFLLCAARIAKGGLKLARL